MGVVYLAEQLEPLRRQVALKVLRPGVASTEALARFKAEQQTLAKLSHPNIATVFDAADSDQAIPFIVMELVWGEAITEYCDANCLRIEDRLGLFKQVCDAVNHVHMKGLIHRDIKPSNIVVAEVDGTPLPKLIDFGIAVDMESEATRLTRTGAVLGTPQYMSPERLLGGSDPSPQSDVYSLGVVLYELLAGTLPLPDEAYRAFSGFAPRYADAKPPVRRFLTLGDTQETVARQRGVTPRQLRRQISGDPGWVTLKAIEREPERRYSSAGDLGADVDRLLTRTPTQAPGPSLARRWWLASRAFDRNYWYVSVAIGLLGTGLIFYLARADFIRLLIPFFSWSSDPRSLSGSWLSTLWIA